jgi:hypothetical protein
MEKVIITMPKPLDSRWKAWAKVLERVDVSLQNGYAFVGKFIPLSRGGHSVKLEREVGELIMMYSEEGSNKYHKPTVILFEVTGDGLKEIFRHECSGHIGWALEVRDKIAQIVEERNKSKQSEEAKVKELLERRANLLQELAVVENMLRSFGVEL